MMSRIHTVHTCIDIGEYRKQCLNLSSWVRRWKRKNEKMDVIYSERWVSFKPRPHHQQRRSNIVECYTILSTKSKQIEHVQFVSTLSKGRNFTINSFDIVAVFGKTSRMLLRQSRTLIRHCCWCGRSSHITVTYSVSKKNNTLDFW